LSCEVVVSILLIISIKKITKFLAYIISLIFLFSVVNYIDVIIGEGEVRINGGGVGCIITKLGLFEWKIQFKNTQFG
jgi:hypothetical protein